MLTPDAAKALVDLGFAVVLVVAGAAAIGLLVKLTLAAWERDRKRGDDLAAENQALRATIDGMGEAMKAQAGAFSAGLDKLSETFAKELDDLTKEVRWDTQDRIEARRMADRIRRDREAGADA